MAIVTEVKRIEMEEDDVLQAACEWLEKHHGITMLPGELDWEWNTREIIAEYRVKEK